MEETLGGTSISYIRLTTNVVIVSRNMVQRKKIDQNQLSDAFLVKFTEQLSPNIIVKLLILLINLLN